MKNILCSLLSFIVSTFRSRASLQLEILALRHQLTVYQSSVKRPKIKTTDRIFWVWLSRLWASWRDTLIFVKPETVIAWQRKRFTEHWSRLSRNGKPGSPAVSKEIRELIRKISRANPTWGSPRIVGELRKLDINIAKSTVEKYMVKSRKPASPTWRAFLRNHARDLVSLDFFVVPTVKFNVLFVLVVLSHYRRRVVHFNVTKNPTAKWTAQQIVEAFPWDTAQKYLLRDRDGVYGSYFRKRTKNMGIEEVIIAPRSPWQNPFAERLIGSIRRECLNHVIVLNEKHLKRILTSYFSYYQHWRTHLSLDMDCPEHRTVQHKKLGKVIKFPEVGGLHHHYERLAA
ncbi:MAG: integrase core domain-containing protein [Nitrospinota bacterium]